MIDSSLGQKFYKMNLKYLLYQVAKNLSKTTKVITKGTVANVKRLPLAKNEII